MQHETVLLRKLDDAAHDRQIRIRATHVKLPDRDVLYAASVALRGMRGGNRHGANWRFLRSSGKAAARERSNRVPQHRVLCPLIAGAGNECTHNTGLPQQCDGLFRRCLLPRVVVVMDVGVEEREFSMAAPSWYARR